VEGRDESSGGGEEWILFFEVRNGYFDPEPGGGDDTLVFDCGVMTPARQVRLSLTFSLSLTPSLSLSLLTSISVWLDL
jgi:hypothetical protein